MIFKEYILAAWIDGKYQYWKIFSTGGFIINGIQLK